MVLYFTTLHNFYDVGAIMDIEIPVDLEKPVIIQDLHCTGNESSIWDCPHNILPQNLTFGDQNAAVLCQGDNLWTNYLVQSSKLLYMCNLLIHAHVYTHAHTFTVLTRVSTTGQSCHNCFPNMSFLACVVRALDEQY